MRFLLDDDTLTVSFEDMEQVWALKRKLVIPKINITNVLWQEGVQLPRTELGRRIGGTGLPGVLFAGRFAGHEGKNFVYLLTTGLGKGSACPARAHHRTQRLSVPPDVLHGQQAGYR